MARRGSFRLSDVEYGVALSFIHPPDNVMPGPYISELLDPSLKLTEAQKQELQDRIDDLFGVLKGERDYV